MKDHEKRELVSELVGIASIAHGTEQLRDRIAYALSGVFSAIDGVTGRADKAEAELERLSKQEPVAYVKYKATGGNVGLSWLAVPTGEFYPREGEPLYAAPVPAVAAPLTSQADCRACVNRGRVNGLSQETYCESCVYEGRNWRKNHFLDAATDRLLEGGK